MTIIISQLNETILGNAIVFSCFDYSFGLANLKKKFRNFFLSFAKWFLWSIWVLHRFATPKSHLLTPFNIILAKHSTTPHIFILLYTRDDMCNVCVSLLSCDSTWNGKQRMEKNRKNFNASERSIHQAIKWILLSTIFFHFLVLLRSIIKWRWSFSIL